MSSVMRGPSVFANLDLDFVKRRVLQAFERQPFETAVALALLVVALTVLFGTGRKQDGTKSPTSPQGRMSPKASRQGNGARNLEDANDILIEGLDYEDHSKPRIEAVFNSESGHYRADDSNSSMFGSMGSTTPTGGLVINNSLEPSSFETEFSMGKFQELHVPTYDKNLRESGEYLYGVYFKGKTRIWETRIQMQFKEGTSPPRIGDLFFGIEVEHYVPLGTVTKVTQDGFVKLLKKVLSDKDNQVHHSMGDDPNKVRGEVERPTFTMPMYAFDQFIVTPEGKEPPRLNDPDIGSMGSKRSGRVSAYKKEIEEIDIQVGATYTFCFWGISKFLDKINWKVINVGYSQSFDVFGGKPPLHLVLYSLRPSHNEKEKRHLTSRKRYYLDCAFWSSKARPPIRRINEMFGIQTASARTDVRKSTKSFVERVTGSFACCVSRQA